MNINQSLEEDLLHLYSILNEENSKQYLLKILDNYFHWVPEEPMLIERLPSYESIPTKPPISSPVIRKSKMNSRNNQKEIDDIEKVIIGSFTNDKITNININLSNNDSIIKIIKDIESNINILHKKELINYIKIGKLLKAIKNKNPNNFIEILKNNNINYGKEYVYLLIRIFNLAEKYKKLYTSSLSIYFIKKNFEVVKFICIKNNY